jgi:hypothetical protein
VRERERERERGREGENVYAMVYHLPCFLSLLELCLSILQLMRNKKENPGFGVRQALGSTPRAKRKKEKPHRLNYRKYERGVEGFFFFLLRSLKELRSLLVTEAGNLGRDKRQPTGSLSGSEGHSTGAEIRRRKS